jgi:hypothetical protein
LKSFAPFVLLTATKRIKSIFPLVTAFSHKTDIRSPIAKVPIGSLFRRMLEWSETQTDNGPLKIKLRNMIEKF